MASTSQTKKSTRREESPENRGDEKKVSPGKTTEGKGFQEKIVCCVFRQQKTSAERKIRKGIRTHGGKEENPQA